MHVGIMIEGQEGLTWERWSRLIEAAEDLGYESLCRSDHLTGLNGQSRRPSLDTWTSLTVVAERTRRIRFGPMVSPITFYHPAILDEDGGGARHAVGRPPRPRHRRAAGTSTSTRCSASRMPPLKERLDRLEAARPPCPRPRRRAAGDARAALLSAAEGGGLSAADPRPAAPRGRRSRREAHPPHRRRVRRRVEHDARRHPGLRAQARGPRPALRRRRTRSRIRSAAR